MPRKTDPNYDTLEERDMDREPPQFIKRNVPVREYLGDGLFMDWDGVQIRLFTQRDEGEHEVYLSRDMLFTIIKLTT